MISHLHSSFYDFYASDSLLFSSFFLGFQSFTPAMAPAAETTIITANTNKYENTILKNSIKFAISLPSLPHLYASS